MSATKTGHSDYVGVGRYTSNGRDDFWMAQSNAGGTNWQKRCGSEREAAIAYDKRLLQLGKEPVNILTRKK